MKALAVGLIVGLSVGLLTGIVSGKSYQRRHTVVRLFDFTAYCPSVSCAYGVAYHGKCAPDGPGREWCATTEED